MRRLFAAGDSKSKPPAANRAMLSSAVSPQVSVQRLDPPLAPLPVLLPLPVDPPKPVELPPVLPLDPVLPRPVLLPVPAPLPLRPLLLAGGQSMFDCAREPVPLPPAELLPVPLLPAVAPELADPRLAELDPCDGLWDNPVLPSGQSAAALLLPLVPLRPELVPALLPLEREPLLPDPMDPEPCEPLPDCMPLPLGALVPDPDPPLPPALPPVCDQPG